MQLQLNYTDNEIAKMFAEEANIVWRNKNYQVYAENVTVGRRISTSVNDPVMSISVGFTNYSSKAIGRTLLRRPPYIKLYIYNAALQKTPEQFRALLRHEALHMGYPRHDENFRYVAKQVNAPLTEYELEGGVQMFELQIKEGSRFKLLEKFDDLPSAQARVREIYKASGARSLRELPKMRIISKR